MSDVRCLEAVKSAFAPQAIEATNAAWRELLERQDIAADQAGFSVLARRDILAVLDGADGAAVIAGYLYRDNDGNGAFEPGEELTATLLGLPELAGADAGEITSYANCFWFGPLEAGQTYTLTYDVEGVAPVTQTVTVEAGLNLLHVPVAPTKPLVYIIPHSHFDPEWRDTYQGYLHREIPQLIERIELLREQPEHCFNFDEECAIRPLVDRHPEIVEELRQRVIEGAIEIKGVVTAGELTMPLGESMIRQMIDGEQLISKLLGMTIRPKIFWNVDNYGINLQMPQILLKAGRRYFSIGEYVRVWPRIHEEEDREKRMAEVPFANREVWENPEFWLEGLDGSKVLVHRSNYGGEPPGAQLPLERLLSHQSAFNHHGGDFMPADRGLPDHVREINDAEKAAKYDGQMTPWGWPVLMSPAGACKHIIATSEQFFRAVEVADDLATLQSESRLGFWTGGYESRVRGRQLSRQVECMLLATEGLSAAATLAGLPSALDDLREAWYELLINHHHDPQLTIMGPGLFAEVIERYLISRRATQRILNRTVQYLTDRITTDAQPGRPVVVFNPLAWNRSSVVSVDAQPDEHDDVRVVDCGGKPAATQLVTDDDGEASVTFLAQDVPPTGWRTYYVQANETASAVGELTATEELLENERIRVELADGLIQKVIEKSIGQAVFAAKGETTVNEIVIWDDQGCIAHIRPVDFMDSAKVLVRSSQVARSVRLVEAGPARAVVEVSFAMDWGEFRQRIILQAGAAWVDFETRVDWRPADEGGRRIRAAFPSTFTGAKVWRDIPFAVQPWEQSEKIQPINSWLGLSDADGTIGGAVIHDGPCSQQVRDDVLWQTLFRSVRVEGELEDAKPDPPCNWDLSGDTALEEGVNTYRLRLCIYAGDWQSAAVPRTSLAFTTPLVVQPGDRHAGNLAGERSHLAVEPADLVQCVWKQSDFTDATIVRIYNPTGRSISGALRVGFDVREADETNFREEHTGELTVQDGRIPLEFGPYEIKTVRLAARQRPQR